MQKSLSQTSGGHGRKKKLRALDKFSEYEKHWVQNYNHYVSKQVVNFAIKTMQSILTLKILKDMAKKKRINSF